ncbi:MAG: lysophospholipid acyltransferase family protein [Bacteroidales bacterium]|jgi:KDO2-lipid IV(A) lauroyltransferase|nr:lysophospholipid acyltransferase family protein [Bacteroidales bacterium]MDD2824151.1 lysophospholipid acyltransferase family protein [Bacteroidales bacterium]MDD3100015.1 lysophospholipid acyltransferase family protein [Bacteroidales bacterium]MDD3638705.1 lysophospholipid acyltransferase family protein [Bacteroidales bacterium]MDD3943516.1 lysophospholipid acyltransferase family protein [Bacteroidales bacterium]
MKAIFSQIGFLIVYVIICLVSLLPLPLLYGLSLVLIVLPMRIAGYRRSVVITNLARSFPERSYDGIQQNVRDFYRYLGRLFAETVWLFTASQKSVMKRFSIENPDLLEGLHQKGKSVVVMLPHMGNWEFLRACSCPLQGDICGYGQQQLHMVYQKVNSPLFDKLIYTLRNRYKTGWKILESKSAARFMARHRDVPGIYAMVSDQCPGPSGKSIPVFFLGQPTLMIEGPEALARKFGFAVVYGVMIQVHRGRYVLRFSPITENAALSGEGEVTREFARLLEQDIRQTPHLWLWSHKRWKRTPQDKARYLHKDNNLQI